MDGLEAGFALYLLLVGLVLFFIAGWVVATAIYCLIAIHNGEPVGPVLKAMKEEWGP